MYCPRDISPGQDVEDNQRPGIAARLLWQHHVSSGEVLIKLLDLLEVIVMQCTADHGREYLHNPHLKPEGTTLRVYACALEVFKLGIDACCVLPRDLELRYYFSRKHANRKQISHSCLLTLIVYFCLSPSQSLRSLVDCGGAWDGEIPPEGR